MKIFITFFICILLLTSASAQSYKLSGRVVGANNLPLQGVSVVLPNTLLNAATDSSGYFKISGIASRSYKIKITKDGYQDYYETLSIEGKNGFITVVLQGEIHQLKEVVVTGNHSVKRKKEESLNIEFVNSNFIQRNLGGSLMKTLERLPGIKTIGIGSGQSKPLIRGLGFNRVIVVDKGVKHEGQQWGADHGLEIDQFAAAEVEVIKGAVSFMYGSDAIGGVIHVKPPQAPAALTIGGSVDLIGKTNNNLYGTSSNLFGRSQHWFFESRITYQSYGDYRVPTDMVSVYNFPVPLYKHHLRNTAGRETSFHLNTGYLGDNFSSIFYLSNIYNKSGFFANAHGLEPRQVDTQLHDASARDIQMPSQEVNHFKLINRNTYRPGMHQLEAELGY